MYWRIMIELPDEIDENEAHNIVNNIGDYLPKDTQVYIVDVD